MKLSLTISALLCVLGIAVITDSHAPNNPETVIVNTHSIGEEPKNVTPVRFVYIQFPGESSQMIQLQNVSEAISERLSEYSVEQ